jgi:hypothetical protein
MGSELLEAFLVSHRGQHVVHGRFLSYKGQFTLGLLGDPKTYADLALLGEGIRRSLAEVHPVAATATAS